jgi:predicted MFS family arabinose efflux permease
MNTDNRSFRTFLSIWLGQVLSLTGSAMTRFALLIWVYQQTGEATTLALLGFFAFMPYVLVSPIAGVWIDRFDRRTIMLLSDVGTGLATLLTLALYATGSLQIWHLYAYEAISSALEAFQVPAYSALTTTLIPKQHFARANGLRSLASDAARITAPVFAGALLPLIDIHGVMLIDTATFIFAVLTLALMRIPNTQSAPAAADERRSIWADMRTGLGFITARRGLLGLLMVYVMINLFAGLAYFGVMPAMLLARTGGDEGTLGLVQAALGIGGVIGGLLLSTLGGPRRKIHGVLGYGAASFLFGDFLFAVGQSLLVWILASLATAVFIPFIIGCNRTIWQMKTPPHLQGRVFAVQGMLQTATVPIGYLLAGTLADRILEPAMQPGGALAPVLGRLVGTGPGAGMASIFLFTATGGFTVCLLGYLWREVRHVELDLPDFDAEPDELPPVVSAQAAAD